MMLLWLFKSGIKKSSRLDLRVLVLCYLVYLINVTWVQGSDDDYLADFSKVQGTSRAGGVLDSAPGQQMNPQPKIIDSPPSKTATIIKPGITKLLKRGQGLLLQNKKPLYNPKEILPMKVVNKPPVPARPPNIPSIKNSVTTLKPGKLSRKDLEHVLDVPGVKCGTVPLYKKSVGRSINESFELSNEDPGAVRILHGLDSFEGEWPWIVRLLNCPGQAGCGTCTGTLINDRWVLTAGHCAVGNTDPRPWTAYIGLNDLVTPEERSYSMRIIKVVLHHSYRDLHNDLSLMKLERPVNFTDYVQPACLAPALRNTVKYTQRKKCYTVGYGVGEERMTVDRLQKLQIRVREPSACNSNKLEAVYLRPNTVCIGPTEGHIGGSCSGDSGGPDLCYNPKEDRWELFGTVSYGPRICDREDGDQWLTVSVDVANFRTWIFETVASN